MRAVLDMENYNVTLDAEAIQAIRFCAGINLIVELSIPHFYGMDIYYWLRKNVSTILDGAAVCQMRYYDRDRFDYMLVDMTQQVIKGCKG